MLMGKIEQLMASIGIEGCTVRDGEAVVEHALIDDVVEEIEGVAVNLLVGGIVTDHLAAGVGRDDHAGAKALTWQRCFCQSRRDRIAQAMFS